MYRVSIFLVFSFFIFEQTEVEEELAGRAVLWEAERGAEAAVVVVSEVAVLVG